MFDQLEIPHKFFQNWIVLRMLGIRNCVRLSNRLFRQHRTDQIAEMNYYRLFSRG